MSNLSELAKRINRRRGRGPLRGHCDAKSFNMKLPVIIKNIAGVSNIELANIIRMSSDVQSRETNVKADMTDWFMQRQFPIFNSLADIAIDIAKEASPHEVKLELYDIWGAIYNRGDFTKAHDHWPHPWSFSYYVKSDGNTPIIFPEGHHYCYPKTNDMVLFPGILRHGVPIHESDEERIIVSGNIDIKYS